MSTPAGDSDQTARVDLDARATPRSGRGDVQFAPGTIIAGRYRIASILGSGGMGEVYRADDIKLDTPVALKFLPARLARDPVLLARLHDEVRLGRQVTHPNVCRIYDIVDDGHAHFVAMEYVDGEDLSRLLKRIGRLAHDKAVDIARGIAAGLAAAHAKGILHRDLKPANVMIDSRGDARVMDFGLALAAGEDDGTIAGTPAYMAPEQFQRQPATVQSDLYALGLVMYELFTGRRALNGRTIPERMRELSSDITTPSSVIREIDPAVERIILRCLANDPSQRPRSAREVIESLPGGDPLAAALAAGETPSPRIVAAAGVEGRLQPWQAWSLLAIVAICGAIVIAGKHFYSITRYVSFEKSPEVQVERASTILRGLGIPQQPFVDSSYSCDDAYYLWLMRNGAHWERLPSAPPLTVFRVIEGAQPQPPGVQEVVARPGTNIASIDSDGHLFALQSIPLRPTPPRKLDWNPLLAAAGLDAKTLAPATPRYVPPTPADAHVAWSGRWRGGATPIHVEAAAFHGTPVFLRISGPWETLSPDELAFSQRSTAIVAAVLFFAVAGTGLALAWRNIRLRRGDRGSALRIAAVMFVVDLARELLLASYHRAGLDTIQVVRVAVSEALLWAAVTYLLYLALEPFVRRHWPQQLIASTRLLNGNYRDPMVGRDVLIGLVTGLLHPTLIMGAQFTGGHSFLFNREFPAYHGARFSLGGVADAFSGGVIQGFMFIVMLVLFALVLRHRVAAAIGVFAVVIASYIAIGVPMTIFQVLIAAVVSFAFARYGLLTAVVAQGAFHCIFNYPLFSGPEWQTLNLLPVVVVAALAIWAFRTSLAGQPAFAKVFDD